MKPRVMVVFTLLVLPCLVLGQWKQSAPATQAAEELMKVEREWAEAAVKADVATISRILIDEFIGTDPAGTVYDKQQALAALKSSANKVISAAVDDMTVRVFGDTGVVAGRSIVKEVAAGKQVTGRYRFTDTWIKRGGRWQCVASQGNRIARR